MIIVDEQAAPETFRVAEPSGAAVPFLVSVPHSGTHYPRSLLRRTRLDLRTLRRSEDTHVDVLVGDVTRLGATLITAHFPRVFVDLNRDEDEIDPDMFDGPLQTPPISASSRVASGLGVIARLVGEGQEIYDGPLPSGEAQRRIEMYWRPYHAALASRLLAMRARFGSVVLVDCHSMPSGAVRSADPRTPRPDIILGDRFGTSCSAEVCDCLARLLRREGFVVGRNRPYAGGYITEHYGRPPAVEALQIEINRALYMDEATFEPNDGFAAIGTALSAALGGLIEWCAERPARWRPAAE